MCVCARAHTLAERVEGLPLPLALPLPLLLLRGVLLQRLRVRACARL